MARTTDSEAQGSIYASVSDVEALNRARKLGVNNTPTADDVVVFLELRAGEINSILLNKGYSVPVDPTFAPAAFNLLRAINAKGAQLSVEESSPTAPNLDRVRKEWEGSLEKLESAAFSLDAPIDRERARPRGPGLTTPLPSTLESEPFFRRGMSF